MFCMLLYLCGSSPHFHLLYIWYIDIYTKFFLFLYRDLFILIHRHADEDFDPKPFDWSMPFFHRSILLRCSKSFKNISVFSIFDSTKKSVLFSIGEAVRSAVTVALRATIFWCLFFATRPVVMMVTGAGHQFRSVCRQLSTFFGADLL